MSEIKLLPCPFCGGEAKFITGSPFIWEHAVACGECGTATRMIGGVTPSMARNRVAQVWNTRKPMQEIENRLRDGKVWRDLLHYDMNFREREIVRKAIEICKEVGGMNG